MSEPFGQILATLHKARDTMAVQLDRHSKAPNPDRARLPRLQNEAGQFRNATMALLGRMTCAASAFELMVSTKELATFFDEASDRAAVLRQGGCLAAEIDLDVEGADDTDDLPSNEGPDKPESARTRLRSSHNAKLKRARVVTSDEEPRPQGIGSMYARALPAHLRSRRSA